MSDTKNVSKRRVNNLNILFVNIRSIRNKINDIIALNIKEGPFDVIILNEIWISSDEKQFFQIGNFNQVCNCRNETRGGGTAIFIRKDLQFQSKIISNEFYPIIVTINKNIKIMTAYRPPHTKVNDFCQMLDNIIREESNLSFYGDVNIDLLKSESAECFSYKVIVESNGYKFLNPISERFATRIAPGSKTIIDHVFSNSNFTQKLDFVDVCFTDHKAIISRVKTPLKRIPPREWLEIKSLNKRLFTSLVRQRLENTRLDSVDELIEIILDSKNKSTTIKRKQTRNPDWMSMDILNKIEERDRIYKLKKKHPLNATYADRFQCLKKEIRSMEYQAKKNAFSKRVIDANGDSRKLWKAINSELGTGNKAQKVILEEMYDGETAIKDPTLIANYLNKYFVNAPESIIVSDNVPRTRNARKASSIFLKPVSLKEVKGIIASLKNKPTCGIDGISNIDLKLLSEVISPHLVLLINASLESGCFPNTLKKAIVIPIFKSGDKKQANNYRPISILTSLSKIFEKVIDSRIRKYITKKVGFDKNQFGFIEKAGTDGALFQTTQHINASLDKREYAAAIFVDLKKAFDTVPHQQLVESLEELGIRGCAQKLIKSYLENRTIQTRVNDVLSSDERVKCGVPQGSILGPLFYLLYIHNIQEIGLEGKYSVFADDTCLLYEGKDAATLEEKMNSDLVKLKGWLDGNKLALNVSKTNFIVFKNTNKPDISLNITINNEVLQRVTSVKYLGMTIDERLNFEEHVKNLTAKLVPIIGALKRCNYMEEHLSRLVINAFVISRIRRNITLWSQCSKELLKKMQVLFTRVIKILFKIPALTPTQEVFEKTGFLNLNQIIFLDKSKFIYKVKNGLMKNNVELEVVGSNHNIPLRNRGQLTTMAGRTKKMGKSLLVSAIECFNKIPTNTQTASSLSVFNSKLKKYVKLHIV